MKNFKSLYKKNTLLIDKFINSYEPPQLLIEYGHIAFFLGIFLLASAPFFSGFFLLIALIIGTIKRGGFLNDKWNYPLILSSILMIISCFVVTTQNNSLNYVHETKLSITGLLNWLPFFWCFWGFQIYLRSEKLRARFIYLLVSGSVPLIVSGLGQYFFKWHGPFQIFNGLIIWFQRPIEIDQGLSGFFSNQNYTATWLGIIFPFTLALIVFNKREKIKSIFTYILFILFGFITILTTSRNAIVSMFIALALFNNKKKFFVFIFISSIIFSIFFSIIHYEIIKNILIGDLSSVTRFEIWGHALNFISEKKWFGWGASSFPNILILNNSLLDAQHVHNVALEIAVSYGILVSLTIVLSQYTLIYFAFFQNRLNKIKKTNQLILEKAWKIASLIFVVSQLFDITIFDIRLNLVSWLLFSGLRNIIRENNQKSELQHP